MASGRRRQDLRELRLECANAREFVEHTAGMSVLGIAPRLHGLVGAVFEPPIIVDHRDAVVRVDHRLLRSRRRGSDSRCGKYEDHGGGQTDEMKEVRSTGVAMVVMWISH